VIVELPYGVDGFVPTSQLAFAPVKNIASYFRIGDKLPLKVIEFDKDSKKIVLSAVEALREMGAEAQEDYYRLHPVPQSGPAGMSHEEAEAHDENESTEPVGEVSGDQQSDGVEEA
jgi:predicted RNA-binding protein with RPS1 domain